MNAKIGDRRRMGFGRKTGQTREAKGGGGEERREDENIFLKIQIKRGSQRVCALLSSSVTTTTSTTTTTAGTMIIREIKAEQTAR